MQQGDLILVPFPFTDLSSQKVRPALVLSRGNLNEDVLICAITSHDQENAIPLENQDLSDGKLPLRSYIKFMKIVTIDKKIIRKKIGKITPEKREEVIQNIKKNL